MDINTLLHQNTISRNSDECFFMYFLFYFACDGWMWVHLRDSVYKCYISDWIYFIMCKVVEEELYICFVFVSGWMNIILPLNTFNIIFLKLGVFSFHTFKIFLIEWKEALLFSITLQIFHFCRVLQLDVGCRSNSE